MIRKIFILVTVSIFLYSLSTTFSFVAGRDPNSAKNFMYGIPYNIVKISVNTILNGVQIISNKSSYKLKNTSILDGVNKISDNPINEKLFLLTSFFGKEKYKIELLDLKTSQTLKQWFPNLKEITKLTLNGKNRMTNSMFVNQLIHPLMLEDSTVIVGTNFSLCKIGKNSEIEWLNSDIEVHHSIELDKEKNIWVSGRRLNSNLPELLNEKNSEFLDDLIVKINPENGNVIFEKSVIQILKDNNLDYLIYNDGNYHTDPIHLNDVQPALFDSDFWKEGDLLISARNLSAIFLYRPSSNKIIWFKQGPWLNQHDPDFLNNNKISVFGNQVLRGKAEKLLKPPSKTNSVFVYDFKNKLISEPFKSLLEKEKIHTISEGRSEILPNGFLFIEETNNGRVIIGDSVNKKLSFAKRLNEDEISYLHWSRIILN